MEVKKDNTDRRTPSANTISKKHGTPLARLRKQLAMGAKIEREHTHSAAKAREIARDHLAEIPDYYSRLKKMEREAGVKESYDGDPFERKHKENRRRWKKEKKQEIRRFKRETYRPDMKKMEREAGVTEAVNTREQLMHKLSNMHQSPMFPKQKNRKIPYVHRATGWQAWLDITPNEQYKDQKHDPLMRALIGIKRAKKKQKGPLFFPQKKWIPENYVDPLEAMHNATRARILKGAKEGKYWLLRSEDIDMDITEAAEYAYSWNKLRPKLQNAAYSGVVAGVPAVAGYIAARKNRNNLKTAAAAVGATSGASQAFRQSQVTKWGKDLNSWEKAFTSKPGGSVTFTDPRTGGRYSSAAPLIRTTREHQATIGAGRDIALGAGGYALGSFLGSRAARKKRMTESERSHLISHIIETVTTGSIGSYNKPLGVDSRDITMGRRNRWTRDELTAAVAQLLNKRSRPMPTP